MGVPVYLCAFQNACTKRTTPKKMLETISMLVLGSCLFLSNNLDVSLIRFFVTEVLFYNIFVLSLGTCICTFWDKQDIYPRYVSLLHVGTRDYFHFSTYCCVQENNFISVPIVVDQRLFLFQYLLLRTSDYFYFSTYRCGPETIFISVLIVVDQRLFLFQYLLLCTRYYFYCIAYCCVPETILQVKCIITLYKG
jgi:hypothetical protein